MSQVSERLGSSSVNETAWVTILGIGFIPCGFLFFTGIEYWSKKQREQAEVTSIRYWREEQGHWREEQAEVITTKHWHKKQGEQAEIDMDKMNELIEQAQSLGTTKKIVPYDIGDLMIDVIGLY